MDLLSVRFVGFLEVLVSVFVFWVVVKSLWAGLFAAKFPLAGFFLQVPVSDVFLVVDVSAFAGALQGDCVCSVVTWT